MSSKIIMLGTGNGGTTELYNTCFVIKNNDKNFLVDTGGGIGIMTQLRKCNIELKDIKNIFISHSHTDHILGIFWLFKKLSASAMNGEIIEKINIYCNETVLEAIKGVAKHILPDKLMEAIYKIINFVLLEDGDNYNVCGLDITFFDIKPRGTNQFGFETIIDGKRLVFLGDETLNSELYDRVKEADYVMHEAFCLDSEEHIFHAYEKHHSTARSVSDVMNKLNVKNLILYHTEDSHGNERKKLYTKEASKYFKGIVIVPDDLEEIDI